MEENKPFDFASGDWSKDGESWKYNGPPIPHDGPADYTTPLSGIYNINGVVMLLNAGDVVKIYPDGTPYIAILDK